MEQPEKVNSAMTVQVVTTCDYQHGTLAHALLLARALARLEPATRLVGVRGRAVPAVRRGGARRH